MVGAIIDEVRSSCDFLSIQGRIGEWWTLKEILILLRNLTFEFSAHILLTSLILVSRNETKIHCFDQHFPSVRVILITVTVVQSM
jgi:hypothetical protein